MAAANVALALSLLAAIAWRFRAWRAGDDALGPFRRPSPLHGPVALFVLLSILSVLFSTDAVRSAGEIKGLVTFLLVLLVSGLVDDVEDAHLLVDALRLTTLYLVLRGLVDYFVLGFDNVWERLSGGLSIYMTYAGLLMVLSLVLAARALTAGRPRRERIADGALAAAAALLVGLTFTRNAYLGLAAGVVVLVLTARPRLALAVPLLVVLLVVVLPAGVRERAASTFDRTDAAARDRLAMWSSGAVMVSERPFFGVGPGRIKELYPVYRRPEAVEANVGHLHDNLVNIAAETGIPSAIAYVAIVVAAFAAGWPLSRDRTRPAVRSLARGALAANVALFVAGLFEYNFGDVEVLRIMLVVLALPFAAARAAPTAAPVS